MNLNNEIKSNYKLLLKIMFVGQWFTTKEFILILLQNIIIYLIYDIGAYMKHECLFVGVAEYLLVPAGHWLVAR